MHFRIAMITATRRIVWQKRWHFQCTQNEWRFDKDRKPSFGAETKVNCALVLAGVERATRHCHQGPWTLVAVCRWSTCKATTRASMCALSRRSTSNPFGPSKSSTWPFNRVSASSFHDGALLRACILTNTNAFSCFPNPKLLTMKSWLTTRLKMILKVFQSHYCEGTGDCLHPPSHYAN